MGKAKILLVQTAQTLGNGTKSSVERAGYQVTCVTDGISATASAERESIDLLLIDVALPDTEGGDLCRLFKRTASTSRIPIILLMGRGYAPSAFRNSAEGPDDFLAKSYTDAELGARIDQALNKQKLKNELEQKCRLLKEARTMAESIPIVDPDTGLYNRLQFEAMFSKEFKRAVRYKQPVSCMRIEMEGRETWQKADEAVVRAVIRLIQDTIREVDTAAWWTGDGFIVLIPNTPRENALQAAARILVAVADHPFTWSDAKQVALNIGIAGMPDDRIDSESKMVEAAEAALLQARQFMIHPPDHIPRHDAGVTSVRHKTAVGGKMN